jgi:hypothetical protein
LADTDTDISESANWKLVSAISVSVSVSATLDICYIGIGQVSVKILGYRPKYRQISDKIPVIGQDENISIGIGGRYVGANISVSAKISAGRIYRYRLDPYRSNPNEQGMRKMSLILTIGVCVAGKF